MNSTIRRAMENRPPTTTVYSDGSECPRHHCVAIDNVVDTFRVVFIDHHECSEIKAVIQQFHEVHDIVQEDDKIFVARTRSISGLTSESIRDILSMFYPILTITHTNCLVVARKH